VINVKGTGEIDSGLGIEGTWKISGKEFSDKSKDRTVMSESFVVMSMTFQGETAKFTTDTTMEQLSWNTNWSSEENPDVGDLWKETKEEEATITNTAVTPEGDDKFTDTATESTVTYYAYVDDENINSKLGNMECKVIQSYDEDDIFFYEDNYVATYIDKELNIPVKTETYEYGDPVTTMELIAYKIGSDKAGTEVIGPIGGQEDEKGMFGLGKIAGVDSFFILMAVILVIIVLIIAVFLLKGHKEEDALAEDQFTIEPTTLPQQPVQSQDMGSQQQPPIPPPPPVPQQVNTYNCPHCGKPFTVQPSEQIQQVSCPSCMGQVTINPKQKQPPPPPPPPEEPETEFQLIQQPEQHEDSRKEALEILKIRLAKGEIDLKVYRELKKEIE
jgi:uncharacterized membrane protein/DNA-directed RNA polymerase subunit RPC12/RpoP